MSNILPRLNVNNFLKTIRFDKLKQLMYENIGLIYTTIGGLVSTILGAFFWLILASILNVEDYGFANFFIAIANVSAGVGMLGLNLTLTTYLAKGKKTLLYEATSFTLISGVASALILSIYHWIAGIVAATTIFFNMTLSEFLGNKKYRKYAYISIGQTIVQIFLSIIFYYPFGIIGIMLGYFLSSIIFSYEFFRTLSKHFTIHFKNLREKRNFILHSYGYNLIGKRLANYFDKVIIGALFGYYTLGLYQLGFQFFMFITIIPTSLSQYLLPEESSGRSKKEIKIIGIILSIAVAIAAYLTTPYLIQNLFPSFTDSIPLVRIMSLAVIPSTIVAIKTANYLSQEKSRTVFNAGIIYMASLIIGIVTLEKIIGILGFALAIIIAQTLQAIYLFTNKK